MRFAAVLLVTFACSAAFASDPGQALDCSDWVIVRPGISCQVMIPADCSGSEICKKGSNLAIDNEGELMVLRKSPTGTCNTTGGQTVGRTAIVVRGTGSEEVVAYLDDRCGATLERMGGSGCQGDNYDCASYGFTRAGQALTFDATNGRLLVALTGEPGGTWMASFSGFATTFDVLQTYTAPASLGFRVPYMPEGMAGADRFDTYWGNLTKPIDFTQAQPLQCGYPIAQPHVGDYLTVADTVPTPAPGQGVYYVTSATYQGATRYGRKTTAGHLSGRDPALLPVCVP